MKAQVLLAPLLFAALSAALDALDVPAFLVRADGDISLANAPGLVLHDIDPNQLSATLRDGLDGHDKSGFSFTKVTADNAPPHWLVVQRRAPADPQPRLVQMTARYGLTPRQCQVLALVVQGKSNKAVCDALDCAESTVELHMTPYLAKDKQRYTSPSGR